MALRTLPWQIKPPAPRIKPCPSEGGKNARHYQSPEHRQWAATVKRRDGYKCVECGAEGPGVRLIADHVIEIEDGGERLDPANGQTLCAGCHGKKTARERAKRASRSV